MKSSLNQRLLSLLAIAMAFAASPIHAAGLDEAASDFRNWTKVEGNVVIEAKIADKKLDNSSAQLVLRSGKSYWVKTDTLIPEDREVIKKWVKPVKHITARVVGSGKGYKTVEVVAKAGYKAMTVKAYGALGTWNEKKRWWTPVIHEVAAGKELKFTYKAVPEYWVEGWSDNAIVDEERAGKKTGL